MKKKRTNGLAVIAQSTSTEETAIRTYIADLVEGRVDYLHASMTLSEASNWNALQVQSPWKWFWYLRGRDMQNYYYMGVGKSILRLDFDRGNLWGVEGVAKVDVDFPERNARLLNIFYKVGQHKILRTNKIKNIENNSKST